MSSSITINKRKFAIQKPVIGVFADIEDHFDVNLRQGNPSEILKAKVVKLSDEIKLAAIIIKDEDKPLIEKNLEETISFLKEHAQPEDLNNIINFFLNGAKKTPSKQSSTSKNTAKNMELVMQNEKK